LEKFPYYSFNILLEVLCVDKKIILEYF